MRGYQRYLGRAGARLVQACFFVVALSPAAWSLDTAAPEKIVPIIHQDTHLAPGETFCRARLNAARNEAAVYRPANDQRVAQATAVSFVLGMRYALSPPSAVQAIADYRRCRSEAALQAGIAPKERLLAYLRSAP